MSHKTILTALTVVCLACPVATIRAQDVCHLLTSDEVSSLIGVHVTAARSIGGPAGRSHCQYLTATPGTALSLTADAHRGKSVAEQCRNAGASPLQGVGDAACVMPVPGGVGAAVLAAKGDAAVHVLVAGRVAGNAADVATRAAQRALTRL